MIAVYTPIEWSDLSEQEQIDYCLTIINEYARLEKPLHDILLDGYYQKDDASIQGIRITHDWRRLKINLKAYCENVEGVNNSYLRYKTSIQLIIVIGLLDVINRYLQ